MERYNLARMDFKVDITPSDEVPVDPRILLAEVETLRMQLLGAIDAAQGAEATRACFEARVRELEHQHHMLKVERDELRRRLDDRAKSESLPRAAAARLVRVLRMRKLINAVR